MRALAQDVRRMQTDTLRASDTGTMTAMDSIWYDSPEELLQDSIDWYSKGAYFGFYIVGVGSKEMIQVGIGPLFRFPVWKFGREQQLFIRLGYTLGIESSNFEFSAGAYLKHRYYLVLGYALYDHNDIPSSLSPGTSYGFQNAMIGAAGFDFKHFQVELTGTIFLERRSASTISTYFLEYGRRIHYEEYTPPMFGARVALVF